MLNTRSWVTAALVVFSSTALCFAVLVIDVIAQDKTARAGIATLTVRALSPFPSCFS